MRIYTNRKPTAAVAFVNMCRVLYNVIFSIFIVYYDWLGWAFFLEASQICGISSVCVSLCVCVCL